MRPASAMLAVTSRRKQPLSADASSAVNGGTRRVLTLPGRGALAITAMAQRSVGMTLDPAGWRRGRVGRQPGARDRADDAQRRRGAVVLALLEVALDPAELVGDVGQAQDGLGPGRP